MATYMAHLRVAEEINKYLNLHEESFITGSMAPDSMTPNEDRTVFTPSKPVTHFFDDKIPKIDTININSEIFYDTYLRNRKVDFTNKEYIFLLGYYVHLLTDISWAKMHCTLRAEDEEYNNKLNENPDFIEVAKKDWYGIDFKYIRDNEDNLFHRVITKIKDIPDYLDFFPKGAFMKKVEFIKWFYTTLEDNFNKEFEYFTVIYMNDFVKTAAKEILELLKAKGIIDK